MRKSAKDSEVRATAARQRRIQADIELGDLRSKAKSQPKVKPVQAGAHEFPVNPLPRQDGRKPHSEAKLTPAPEFTGPQYLGSGKLAGRVALITGGDSGIGRAVAVLFAREGADIAIGYLNKHDDARTTKWAVENEGRKCLLIPGDVKRPAYCRRTVAKVIKVFGKLDVLVNNAAFQEHARAIENLSDTHFDETMKTNVYGYLHMARAAIPHLSQGASIINTGSVTGLEGSKELVDYSATKGAIHAFTKSLASNLLPRGIRVNAVAPGPVWTPLNPADKSAAQITSFGLKADMHRPAQPEEIAPAYVFLAAPACSSYITGVVLPVTGSVGAY